MKALSRQLFILVVATLLGYLSALPNAFVWDDQQFIVKNVHVRDFDIRNIVSRDIVSGSGFTSNYYRPLTSLTFAIDHALWGYNPVPFRLVNELLHTGAGILLYLFLRSLKLGEIAFWVSLFFLVHPLQVEAVTYINSRGDSLYGLFLFASLYVFTRFVEEKRGLVFGILIGLFFILGLLSKELAIISLPLIGLTMWHLGVYRRRSAWVLLATLLFIGVVYFGLRLTVFNFDNSINFYKQSNIYADNLHVRILTFCRVLFEYLRLIVFPYPLHMERSVQLVTSFFSPWALGVVTFLLSIFSWSIYQLRKYGRQEYTFGLLWFLIALGPVSGIIPINGILYEHWLYVPVVGVLVFGGAFVKQYVFPLLPRRIFESIGWAVAVVCIALTIRQNSFWKDPITIFTYTLQHAQTTRLYTNLAVELANEGRVQEAIPYYIKATTLDDSFPHTHYNLGNAYFSLGDYQQAEQAYLNALAKDPAFHFVFPNLINTYLATKQYEKALPYFEKALPRLSEDEAFKIVYGVTLSKSGREEQSQSVLDAVIAASSQKEEVRQKIEDLKRK